MARVAVSVLLLLLLLPGFCAGQGATVYTIDTVVGGAVYDNLPATSTPLSFPNGLWLDRDGGLWVADSGNQVIRRIDPATGVMRVMVGGGTVLDDAVSVPATSVRLDRPSHLVGDAAGNLYFTDSAQNRVRKLTADGQVTTVVGTGQLGFAGDGGPARQALLDDPAGLAFDASGNLYISHAGNCRVRRVDTAGTITTVAGNGSCDYSGDGGPAPAASLGRPDGLAFDSRGNLYIAVRPAVRRVDRDSGIITTVVGIAGVENCSQIPDGTLATARAICSPNGVVFDQEDNLYFSYPSGLARVSAATGQLTNLARGGGGGAVVRDGSGRLLFAIVNGGQIRRVASSGGPFAIVAGSDDPFDGPARLSVLGVPRGLGVDSAGNVYIADANRGRVRRFNSTIGQVTTVLGGGSTPVADGVAASAAGPWDFRNALADPQGNIFFTDPSVLWRVDVRTGTISRVAGRPDLPQGFSGDGGPALQATFGHVGSTGSIALDSAGNIYVGDDASHRVRRIDAATGIINTVAGNGTDGNSGDGGPATAAAISSPRALVFDRQGQLLFVSGNVIRRLNPPTGLITTVQARSRADQPLSPAQLQNPSGIAVDRDGNIFVAWGRRLIRQIRASDGVLVTIAGSAPGFFGDGGPASLARLSLDQSGLVADAAGNVYVADTRNSRVRKVGLTVVLPEMAVSPGILFSRRYRAARASPGRCSILPARTPCPSIGRWKLPPASAGIGSTPAVHQARLRPPSF